MADFIKIFSPAFYSQGMQVAVPLYINHLDTSHLIKEASPVKDLAKSIQKEAGYSYIRVIAMGAGDYYGPNSNGDFFAEDELKRNHVTFEKIAHVYRHHVNKDPEKSYGRPIKSWYNDDMKRVELLLKISNDKNRDIIQRLEAEEDVPVSMAAKVKFDVCSICDNHAKSLADHCGHLKFSMNKLAGDGRKVFAYNPNPVFFDISFVSTPADKIAYTLEKVASAARHQETRPAYEVKIPVATRPSLIPIKKTAFIKKISEIEKMIDGVLSKDDSGEELTDEETETKNKMETMSKGLPDKKIDAKGVDQDTLVAHCKKNQIALEPDEFCNLCGIDDKDLIDKIKSLIPGGFKRLLGLDEDFMSEIFDRFNQSPMDSEVFKGSMGDRALDEDSVNKRIIVITMTGKKPARKLIKKEKEDGKEQEKEADGIAIKMANLYNICKVAVCENVDPFLLALHNYYQL